MTESAAGQDQAKGQPGQRGMDRTYWVAIMCPDAHFPTPVGISTTKAVFETSHFKNNSSSCLVCGKMHVWDKSNSFLLVPRGNYVGEHFENDVLVLDASSFDRCVIRKCDIYLSRGNFRLTNSEISGSKFQFSGEAQVVKMIVDSLKG